MKTKSIFRSKTFWYNVLTVVVGVATVFGYTPDQKLAEDVTGFLAAISPFVNILLRLRTTQPVTVI